MKLLIFGSLPWGFQLISPASFRNLLARSRTVLGSNMGTDIWCPAEPVAHLIGIRAMISLVFIRLSDLIQASTRHPSTVLEMINGRLRKSLRRFPLKSRSSLPSYLRCPIAFVGKFSAVGGLNKCNSIGRCLPSFPHDI